MPLTGRWTLTRYLIEERRRYPQASGELNALILDVALACKAIARIVACGRLHDAGGGAGTVAASAIGAAAPAPAPASAPGGQLNVQGEVQKPLDVIANEIFVRMNEWNGHLGGMASEELAAPAQIPASYPRGKYLLAFDPLDGSSNIDVNVAVGSIFGILRMPEGAGDDGRDVTEADFLQPGAAQVAAGYAIYGPTTMLVLTVGNGVAGFTLDPNLGEFVLSHPDIRVPADASEFAINSSNARFWEPPVKRYVDECLAGRSGPRGRDFNMRWIASLVAEAHRILMRGGVFMYPRDTKDASRPGRLRLLYEANPIGFVMEQAGGRASTGRQPVLRVQPSSLHQRIGFVFGSRSEVERIERYHHDPATREPATPLFAERSLFRD
ncbi:MAG: class 1 fructose-bisphosphatase [Proteobacteria bacterium]|jgi:fructose-1,6-bisphosphatase I/sedoheptulose-1,7-bisphosphatase|nr:class 1 fructose-bisphosphatase [Pseudomonadota bacterium]